MSKNEDFLIGDPKWDEEEEAVEGGGNTNFAKARLYYPLYVNRFKTGEHFALPGVFYDKYDETTKVSSRIGPKEFRGMTLSKGGKYYMALVVLEMQNKEHQWYQRQIQFCNWKDKDSSGCAWLAFQKEEMRQLSDSDQTVLIQAARDNSWTFIQYVEAETGYTGQYEIKKYLTDIVVFKSEKEWQEAETAFRSQFSDDGVSSDPTTLIYPASWDIGDTTPEGMIAHGRTLEKGMSDENLAKELRIKVDGKSALTQDVKSVNVAALIAEIRPKKTEDKTPF